MERPAAGRCILKKGEGGSYLNVHIHMGACKTVIAFAKSGSLWLVRSGEVGEECGEKILKVSAFLIVVLKPYLYSFVWILKHPSTFTIITFFE